jgi:Ring finger domain
MAVHQGGVATSGQSRARGLTRAILDTFPVVKFGSSGDTNTNVPPVAVKDVEAHSESTPRPDTSENAAMEMQGWETIDSVNIDADGVEPERRIPTVSRSPGRDVTTDEEHDDRHESSGSRGTTRNSVRRSSADTEASSSDNRGEGPSRPSKPRNSIEKEDVMPDAIGRETCPICIVAFAEGDDLRLLPCEGKHRFHQQCVDPWLLELSSSCPICRQGT